MIPKPTRDDLAINLEMTYADCLRSQKDYLVTREGAMALIRLLADCRAELKETAAAFVRMEKYANERDAILKRLQITAGHLPAGPDRERLLDLFPA